MDYYPPPAHDPDDASEKGDGDFFSKPLRNAPRKTPSQWSIAGGIAVLCLLAYLLSSLMISFTRFGHALKVNVIFMISDGFGPASETFAREYIQYLHTSKNPQAQTGARWAFEAGFGDDTDFGMLPLDKLLVGQSRTRSANSLVTDSAAGATAFSCALKTFNGAIAVDPVEKNPCGTLLEAAKHKGFLTGIATTSRLTHATPASFYAHVVDRDMESEIATFLTSSHPLNSQVDLAFGGGLCFLLPNSSVNSCRSDNINPIQAIQHDSSKPATRLITTRKEFDNLPNDKSSLGTIGAFNLDHLNYEIDRMSMEPEVQEPSLKNMSTKLLSTLSSAAAKLDSPGYFVMIEGARIDMAAHSNDPIAHLYDILAYQETVREVKKFVDQQNNAGWPTILISVSDHETGGLSCAKQLNESVYPDYLWYPDVLVNATSSTISLATTINANQPVSEDQIKALLSSHLGINDPTEAEVRSIQEQSQIWALDKVSNRAQLGWSTHGHSGVDVNLHAYGYQANKLKGSVENNEIGTFVASLLNVELSATTSLLMRTSRAWHTKDAPIKSNTVGIAHYHGHDALSHGGSSHLYLEGGP